MRGVEKGNTDGKSLMYNKKEWAENIALQNFWQYCTVNTKHKNSKN